MKGILLDLLLQLEAIGNDHEELFDSEVRERIGDAIMRGFVRPESGYLVPGNLGLSTESGNARVASALCKYIDAANRRSAQLGLGTFHQRLAAFQDKTVRTPTDRWNDFDEFFGT